MYQAGIQLGIEPAYSESCLNPDSNSLFRLWADGSRTKVGFHALECKRLWDLSHGAFLPYLCNQYIAIHLHKDPTAKNLLEIARQNNLDLPEVSDWIYSCDFEIAGLSNEEIRLRMAGLAHGFLARDTFLSYLCGFGLMTPVLTQVPEAKVKKLLINVCTELTLKDVVTNQILPFPDASDEIQLDESRSILKAIIDDIFAYNSLEALYQQFIKFYLDHPSKNVSDTLRRCKPMVLGQVWVNT